MKLISKLVLVAAVAGLAFAGSATDSTAARAKKKPAPAAACMPGAWKVATCSATSCTTQRCWGGKWYPSMIVCWKPWCPK